jgi:hypothetical protein
MSTTAIAQLSTSWSCACKASPSLEDFWKLAPAMLCVDRVRRPCTAAGATPHSCQHHPSIQRDIRRSSGGRRVRCTGSESSRAASRRQATAGELNLEPGCFARQLHGQLVGHRAKLNFVQAARLLCAQARSALSLGSAAKPQGSGQQLLGGRKALLLANRAAEGVENIPCTASGHAAGAALQHVPCRRQTTGTPAGRQACEVPARMTTAQPRVVCRAGSSMRHGGADAKRPLDTSPLLPHKRRQLVRSRSHVMSY